MRKRHTAHSSVSHRLYDHLTPAPPGSAPGLKPGWVTAETHIRPQGRGRRTKVLTSEENRSCSQRPEPRGHVPLPRPSGPEVRLTHLRSLSWRDTQVALEQ